MSYWRLYYHLVWATKGREHLLTPEVEDRIYPYLVRKAAELGVYVYAIDGWHDHVHLVAAVPPKQAISHVAKMLKGASSHYVNHQAGLEHQFAWQRGYGALTLGERQRPRAEAYVRNQKEHHTRQTANAWLERYTELDEGPPEAAIAGSGRSLPLREDREIYDAWGEPPF